MDRKMQKFLIFGGSKSGYAVANYLLESGNECFVIEEQKTPKILEYKDKIIEKGGVYIDLKKAEEMLEQIDVLVISPGIPINHKLCILAKEKKKRIMGELEFGYSQFLPTIIAVTGTNGKTTTVSLIGSILSVAKKKNLLLGNIGNPMTAHLNEIDKDTICVTEVSSFQLESVNSFCPHVSCILNITPDHLERHYTMENYVYLKKKIYKNMRESEYLVLNYDDKILKAIDDCRAKKIWVSLNEKVDGAYCLGEYLYYKDQIICKVSDVSLDGKHNLYNALFAIVCAKILGISDEYIVEGFRTFKGVPHRLELVATKNEIDFYNDSKSTNTASTMVALKTMKKPTILILGGSEKGEKYDELFKSIKNSNVKHIVLTGASRFKMLECATHNEIEDLTIIDNFEYAVKYSKMIAKSGEAVLLSPACASFDSFTSFVERGNKFTSIVEKF